MEEYCIWILLRIVRVCALGMRVRVHVRVHVYLCVCAQGSNCCTALRPAAMNWKVQINNTTSL